MCLLLVRYGRFMCHYRKPFGTDCKDGNCAIIATRTIKMLGSTVKTKKRNVCNNCLDWLRTPGNSTAGFTDKGPLTVNPKGLCTCPFCRGCISEDYDSES